jgi:hypothetical protein
MACYCSDILRVKGKCLKGYCARWRIEKRKEEADDSRKKLRTRESL